MAKICKFGGTSMADAAAIKNVAGIIKSDSERKYIVISAPGKRDKADEKVTDLLYKAFEFRHDAKFDAVFTAISERYNDIVKGLGMNLDLKPYLDEVRAKLKSSVTPDYAASRGEYLNALIIAAYLNFKFIDAETIIKFMDNGQFNSEYTNDLVSDVLSKFEYVVIPGFYGAMPNGEIKTFSRGGSDVTGAIIARGINANVYENWTDVNGFLTADPRIVDNPALINTLSYKELRELSYMGASVLHEESIFPVRTSNIPINIKNTFAPEFAGTMIVPSYKSDRVVTGIAGKKGFSVILIEKSMMNAEKGFARRILSVLEQHGLSFEHMPSGIDTLSIVLSSKDMEGKEDGIVAKIRDSVSPDTVCILKGLAVVAVVGHGMAHRVGTASRIFSALAKDNINIRMIDQGSSELNIMVGVDEADCERAIRAIYKEFYHA
jgi:aspartate kinase